MSDHITYILSRAAPQGEPYDAPKLQASLNAACLAVQTPAGQAELTAKVICRDMLPWIMSKHELTSYELRLKAATFLKVHNPRAAERYRRAAKRK